MSPSFASQSAARAATNGACSAESTKLSLSSIDLELIGAERWYVVQTLHHREAAAECHLRNQGFRPFIPRFRKTVRHARKLRTVQAPLFPGYLFVILDPDRDRWRSINGTYGVARLITAHEKLAPVPQGVIEAFVSRRDHSGVVRLDDGLKEGQIVRVLTGPFAQILGKLERLDDRGRVRVLLEIMGGKIAAELDRSALVPA